MSYNKAEIISTITVLKEVLGTMVIEPNFTSDPQNIGSKTYVGNIQRPIVEGKAREIVGNKLLELVSQL